jgi:PAS domain S-box-containing protein
MNTQGTILVVDDSPANLKLLVDTLTAEGYQVLPADSGEFALAAVAARPPELILLDIRMPGLNGFEVCRRLKARAESRDIPILFISAFGESAERVEGLKLGAVDFISKPFQREELLARVQTHLELQRLRVQLEQQAADLRRVNEQLQTELAERHRSAAALVALNQEMQTSRSASVNLMDDAVEARNRLETANQELRSEMAERQRAENELARNFEAQAALYALLRLSTEDRTTTEFLDRALDLVLSLKWLALESKGAIFLADEARKTLHLQVHKGFSKDLLAICSTIPFGRCLCGRAAITRAIQFADHVDERHDMRYEGILPHGHYCVPILSDDHVLGVINLYVEEGHTRNSREEGFLEAVASTLAGAIERKRAQQALLALSSRQEAILAAVPDIIMEVDNHKVYTWANEAGLAFFGDDVIGKEAACYFAGEQTTYQTVQPLFNGYQNVIYVESWQRRKDGEKRLLAWWCRGLKDESGNVTGALSSGRDITEQKQAAEALRESEIRYRTLVEHAPVAVFVNRADRVVLANADCLRLFGATAPEQLLGKSPFELFHPDFHSAMRERIHQLRDKGKAVPLIEEKIIRLDGTPVDVEVTAAPFQDQGINAIHVVLRDITERKRADAALRQNARELQEKNTELARFTYTVSHDLKSPLVTIKTFLGYLEQDTRSQDAARMEKDMNYIRGAADKMARLLDELLDLSRVGHKMNPAVEVSLQTVVHEVLDLVAGQIAERGVQVEITGEPVVLFGDRPRLVELFQNLVDNAVKFMGDQPSPRVEIGVELAGGEVVMFVRDNGMGIDPRYQPKVFGLFEKFDSGTEGTGIGLALVKRIVEVHGGRIWAESKGVGKGATFRFTLAKTQRQPAVT